MKYDIWFGNGKWHVEDTQNNTCNGLFEHQVDAQYEADRLNILETLEKQEKYE